MNSLKMCLVHAYILLDTTNCQARWTRFARRRAFGKVLFYSFMITVCRNSVIQYFCMTSDTGDFLPYSVLSKNTTRESCSAGQWIIQLSRPIYMSVPHHVVFIFMSCKISAL